MKVLKIEEITAPKLMNGTLPDIDTDFPGKQRGIIKQYIEERFGREQVCSVGTFTSMLVKGATKDLSRALGVDFNEANLITSIIEKEDKKPIDLYRRAATEPRLKRFIKENSDLFYMLPSILGQPRSSSIHPCAMIVFPEVMKAEEWVPLRKQSGQIVSEWSGYEMDDAGFLKDDILGIKQLDKFTDILDLIEKNGGERPDIYNLPHDPEVYRYFRNGWNADVFQFKSAGLTGYIQSLKPQTIEDLTVAVAVYRPGPMENHYHEIYVKCKNEGRKVEYLWGTEEITKNTFGLLVYQEQIMQVCQRLGNLSMRQADDVRRAMGKLKVDSLKKWKAEVQKGFISNGATEEIFEEIWNVMLEFAKYCFNRSHAVVYAMTGYVSQWLKVNHPLEYWTAALSYADEEKVLEMVAEILQAGKIKVNPPNINTSLQNMISSKTDIFWGIESIKGIGEKTAIQIIEERDQRGEYTSLTDFILRHSYKGSAVKKQTFEALIACGAFDELYSIKDEEHKRISLFKRFRLFKKVKVSNPKTDILQSESSYERWYWQLIQKNLIKLVFIQYSELVVEHDFREQFATLRDLSSKIKRPVTRAFGGYVVEFVERRSKRGKFARMKIETNFKIYNIIVWADAYEVHKEKLKSSQGNLILFSGDLAYEEKYSKANQFTIQENSTVKILKP